MPETIHLGKKISRLRELRGMKQETLAEQLGISQQAVSKIEQSEIVDDTRLAQIAKVLGVSEEVIKNFREEAIFSNYIYDQNNTINQVYLQFNPIEKIVELYDALLKTEREKSALLEKVIEKLDKK